MSDINEQNKPDGGQPTPQQPGHQWYGTPQGPAVPRQGPAAQPQGPAAQGPAAQPQGPAAPPQGPGAQQQGPAAPHHGSAAASQGHGVPHQGFGAPPAQPGSATPPGPPGPPAPPAWAAQPVPPKRRWGRRSVAGIATLAVVGAAALGGMAVQRYIDGPSNPSASSSQSNGQSGGLQAVPNQNGVPQLPDGTQRLPGGFGQWPGSSDSDGGSGQTEATAKQQTGVVTIDTVVDYGRARAAGSGIILSSEGLVLTNHHVVEGATQIKVTVESTGRSYDAEVVGTDASHDVAVVRLKDASDLTPATVDHDGDPAVGDTVTTVGNSEGRGVLMAATGTVTALNQTITAGNEGGGGGERLSGLIEADVDVVSGDSGGAMLDSQGEVVGMTTAASSGTANVTGYAIDIDDALKIAQQIEAGQESDTVDIGRSAFLGVMIESSAPTVGGTVDGSPAANAGLTAGDTITEVAGTHVGTSAELSAELAKHHPGDDVRITWTTADGSTRSATVTLVAGPVA